MNAEYLNHHCLCSGIHDEAINHYLRQIPEHQNQVKNIYVPQAIFVENTMKQKMNAVIKAMLSVFNNTDFQTRIRAKLPTAYRHLPFPAMDYLCFDFHLTAEYPKLIEVNTNPGGAFIAALLESDYKTCQHAPQHKRVPLEDFKHQLLQLFQSIWQKSRPTQAPRTLVIVDESPKSQRLYPEFLFFQQLFLQHQIQTFIVEPQDLSIQNQALYYGDTPIDMVYNRLTDFYFEHDSSRALKEAYLQDLALITPCPLSHALYANKENLVILSDRSQLETLGIDPDTLFTLQTGIAQTAYVKDQDPKQLWTQKKAYYFKPYKGYGSKGVYRGDKMTKRVFEDILKHDYLIQEQIPPSKRSLKIDGGLLEFSVDLRLYRASQSMIPIDFDIARVYRGQTTSFSSPGSGFAAICYL